MEEKDIMMPATVSLWPNKQEIGPIQIDRVRNWILTTAAGQRTSLPASVRMALWVGGVSKYVVNGSWQIDGESHIYLGNGPGLPTPLWAPSALFGVAYFHGLDDEQPVMESIWDLLHRILARNLNPMMLNLAENWQKKPVHEFAVCEAENLIVARFPTDNPGKYSPWQTMGGEVVEVDKENKENPKKWVKLRM